MIADALAKDLPGHASEFRCQHGHLAAFDLEHWVEPLSQFALEHVGFAQWYHNPRRQRIKQVRLNVEQVRDASASGGVSVTVNVELRHQNERSPSLNTPSFSTCSL